MGGVRSWQSGTLAGNFWRDRNEKTLTIKKQIYLVD